MRPSSGAALTTAVLILVAAPVWAQTETPARASLPALADLPAAPYATMGMKLEKTFLKIDVLALTLRVDEQTAGQIGLVVVDHPKYERDLEAPVAQLAITPRTAIAEIEFLRGVSLDQFMDGVRDDMKKALDAGWLEAETFAFLSDSLPVWFGFLDARRIQDGDRLSYAVKGDTLRTVYWGAMEDEILLDQTDVGRQNVLALLGAYFAPKSSFRKALVRSLWEGWDPTDP